MSRCLTDIFDVRKPKTYRHTAQFHLLPPHQTDRITKEPFTFYAYLDGIVLTPSQLGEESDGFRTEALAAIANKRCLEQMKRILHDNIGVWGLFKNSDAISGSGSLVLDSIFQKPLNAFEYLLKQGGIIESSELLEVRLGISSKGTTYYWVYYHGGFWSVKFLKFSD